MYGRHCWESEAQCPEFHFLTRSQVIGGCQIALTGKASQQALPKCLSGELKQLVVSSTHRIPKVREIASRYLNRLLVSFPSLMCDPHLVFAILEVLTLLQRGTENEFVNEVRNIITARPLDLSNGFDSMSQPGNIIPNEPRFRFSWPIIIKSAEKFLIIFCAMQIPGLSWLWVGPLWNYSRHYRSFE